MELLSNDKDKDYQRFGYNSRTNIFSRFAT